MRGSYNNITWDGINIQENYLRGNQSSGLFAQAAPSVAGVGEFTITTQNVSASDGTGAAQIKIITPGSFSLRSSSTFKVPSLRPFGVSRRAAEIFHKNYK
jgi:activator of HSP90 ATPase